MMTPPRFRFARLAIASLLGFALLAVAGGCSLTESASYRGAANYAPAGNYGGPGLPPPDVPPLGPGEGTPTEDDFGKWVENDFVETATTPDSYFSVDVDTASYAIGRRFIESGRLPDPASVRVEEYLNSFSYNYPRPADAPVAVHLDGAPSPFGQGHHLIRVGIQAREVSEAERKPVNLVFLVDVSGSMDTPDRLPLVKQALRQVLTKLRPTDTLGIVVYAGQFGTLLEPTPVRDAAAIARAIDALSAGGGTNGEGGIRAAYAMAERARTPGSVNRVVLCTDGDFNVGVTGDELVELVGSYREKGIALSVFGFGMGNLKDGFMEQLAAKGNGNYAYISDEDDVTRFVHRRFVATMQIMAKDVKVQVSFNPVAVERYRLLGYENRRLTAEEFADRRTDAGDMGAGHSVTALFEVTMRAKPVGTAVTARFRYKGPDDGADAPSREIARALAPSGMAPTIDRAPGDLRFAAAVAEFAEILRESKHSTGRRFPEVARLAQSVAGEDGERRVFLGLVTRAGGLSRF